ncbi:hypothetical protein ACO2Q3_13035 [Caulobacter sp. KR2-114]|uniref:hypothetical protein n=1 Tax=Caulobacter sp. KR2-114 TaxID=3400912 RepID=UPI003BFAD59D
MIRLPTRRLAALAGLAIMVSVPAGRAVAGPADLYYERTVMVVAGQRCALFTPELLAALASAQLQARGAALRAGAPVAQLDATAERARARAEASGCGSADIRTAADRVRTAFRDYQQLKSLSYPGDFNQWIADRTAPSPGLAVWRLVQSVRFGPDLMDFGMAQASGPPVLVASAGFADGARPYAARLVIREVSLTPGPFLNPRAADARGRIPLPSRMPPRSAMRAFAAQTRTPSGRDLLPVGAKSAWVYRFPDAAVNALTGLDPREAVAVEFIFSGRTGDTVRTAYVEVGDFAAGRAFLHAPQR